jgi:hypothetical protein
MSLSAKSSPPLNRRIISYGIKGYNHDAILTYVFYDTKFKELLESLGLLVSNDDAIDEFKNDYDVINILYSNECCGLFNIKHPNELESACIDILFSKLHNITIHECLEILKTKKSCIGLYNNSDSIDVIHRRIFPLLFSYDLLFFTHIYIRSFIQNKQASVEQEQATILITAINNLM